jgi:hypothetical protein
MLTSGPRMFFSLGGSTSIAACAEPVVLDCGAMLVEVEAFTTAFGGFSGFGLRRDPLWFAQRYLGDSLLQSACFVQPILAGRNDSWPVRKPFRLMEKATDWRQARGDIMRLPAGTLYVPADQDWASPRRGRLPVWCEVIDRHPQLAGGWTRDQFRMMKRLLNASARILAGTLRLVPGPMHELSPPEDTVAEDWLVQVESHIRAGRLPLM